MARAGQNRNDILGVEFELVRNVFHRFAGLIVSSTASACTREWRTNETPQTLPGISSTNGHALLSIRASITKRLFVAIVHNQTADIRGGFHQILEPVVPVGADFEQKHDSLVREAEL